MIDLLSLIEPWMFFTCALALLAIGVTTGEITILPWIALAVFSVGIADFLGLSTIGQIVVFCLVLFVSIYLSHKFISIKGRQNSIAESSSDLVNKTIIITKIQRDKSNFGIGLSASGKSWNVQHEEGVELEIGKKYYCTSTNGITLIIKGMKDS